MKRIFKSAYGRYLISVFAIGFYGLMHAIPVQFDTTYGPYANGTVITPIGTEAEAQAMLLQPDGKVVLAGNGYENDKYYIFLARYDSSGILDPSFGTAGIIKTTINNGMLSGRNMMYSSDDKILVSGATIVKSDPQFATVRYLNNGTLDNSWGTEGIGVCPVYGIAESIYPAAHDNKIVGAGTMAANGQLIAGVSQMTSDGQADLSFGQYGGGSLVVLGSATQGHEVITQSDGKILIAGAADISGNRFFCARFTENGTLDTTFGPDHTGSVTAAFPDSASSQAFAVGVQTDGKIVLAGESDKKVALMRYTATGDIDTTFGTNGFVTAAIGAVSSVNSFVFQTDGKIVAAGSSDGRILVMRYSADGSLDQTFGIGGTIITALGSVSEAQDVVVDASGNIIVGGSTDTRFAAIRYRPSNTDFVAITSPADGSTVMSSTFHAVGTSSQAGLTVRTKLGSQVLTTVTTDAAGNWDAGISPVVANGVYSLTAELINGATVIATTTNTFTMSDGEKVSIIAPEDGSTVNTNKPLVAGQSSHAGAIVTLLLDGEPWADVPTDTMGTWQIVIDAIIDGAHTLDALLVVDGSIVATTSVTFTSQMTLCNNLRVLGGIFTTGNPPIINAGSGSSCPPACDFTVRKVDANVFNISFGYPFNYAPIIFATAEKARSLADGFLTIEDAETKSHTILRLHGRASQIHFGAASCRG